MALFLKDRFHSLLVSSDFGPTTPPLISCFSPSWEAVSYQSFKTSYDTIRQLKKS